MIDLISLLGSVVLLQTALTRIANVFDVEECVILAADGALRQVTFATSARPPGVAVHRDISKRASKPPAEINGAT